MIELHQFCLLLSHFQAKFFFFDFLDVDSNQREEKTEKIEREKNI